MTHGSGRVSAGPFWMTRTWTKRLGRTGACVGRDAIGTGIEGGEDKGMFREHWTFPVRVWGESLEAGMEGE